MRVGTASQNDLMLQQVLRQQTEISDLQQKVATGKKYTNVEGFGAATSHLVNSHSLMNQIESYRDTNSALLGRLGAFDTGLQELEAIAGEFRDVMQRARGVGDGTGFQTEVTGLLERATSVLNTRVEGRFLFGGLNTDEAPVNVTSEAELIAAAEPPAGNFFTDSGRVPVAKLDERTELSVGATASQVAGDLLHGMQRVLMFANGTLPAGAGGFAPAGSFEGRLDPSQQAFLEGEMSRIFDAVSTLQTAAADNGVNMKTVEAVQERLESQSISLTEIIANEEDVDLAKVANRLNQQQLSLEASLRMIAEMRSMSILNVL